jgi:hypothetical protein
MRRSITVLGAGALLLAATACGGSDSTSSAAPAAATTGAAAATTPAAVETSAAAPAGTESTKKVCGKATALLEGKQMKNFGGELGKMIVYKQSKNTDKADDAKAAAKKRLNQLADDFEAATADAKDPELQAAGQEAADSIRETAKDNAFFARIKTIKGVDKELQNEIVPWVTPLSTFCS